jgi:hypothetical protein
MNSYRLLRKSVLAMILIAGPLTFACDEGFQAFQATVFAKIRKDCAKCHDGSVKIAPPFATPDAFTSYQMVSSYMNFTTLEESLLVVRAGNGHCGLDNCRPPSNQEMLEMANGWWDGGEAKCERNGRYFSEEVMLPNNLPTPEQGFMTLSFDLGKIKPELTGYTMQVDAQDYLPKTEVTRGAYRFRSPRVIGGTGSVEVKDLKVLLNGKYDVIYNQYTGIQRVIPFFDVGGMPRTPVLSGESIIMLKDSLPVTKVSISFVDINPSSSAPVCLNQDMFEKTLKPVMQTSNCASCHNSAATTVGEKILDLKASTESVCKVSSALVDPSFWQISPLYSIPNKGLFGHPQLTDDERIAFAQALRTWLNQ